MPVNPHTAALLALLISGSAIAATPPSAPQARPELVWSAADAHETTGVTVHIELLTGLEDEGTDRLGQTAVALAWLLRAPLPQANGASLQELATQAGIEVQTEVDWRHASVTLWAPEELGDSMLWLSAARLSEEAPVADASALQSALDGLATRWQDDAVGPLGDGFETLRRHMLGLRRGSTRLSSYLHADRMEDDKLLEVAARVAREAPARVIVVAPESALKRLRDRAPQAFATAALRPTPRVHRMEDHRPVRDPREGRLVQQHDGRHRAVMAWRLPALQADGADWRPADTAALLSLSYWARHPGGGPAQELVAGHAIAQKLESRAWLFPSPSFALEATSRGREMSDLKVRLARSVERLATQPLSVSETRAAARLAKSWLHMRWAYGPDRARLIGELLSVGLRDPDAWFSDMGLALDRLTPEQVSAFVRSGVNRARRQVLYVVPRDETDVDRVRLDGDQIASYLRLVVDLRCPAPGAPKDVSSLLKDKYDMAPRRYVAITRALASNPALMRDLSEEAERRCSELKKLRQLLQPARVPDLHEAIVCGPGLQPTSKRGQRKLKRIWRKYDIDPSWYRPLLEATREDPSHSDALVEIDKRCGAAPEEAP